MTPTEWATESISIRDYCTKNAVADKKWPNTKTLQYPYKSISQSRLSALSKAQSKWDAYQWTEYDVERQRLDNTDWYQFAIKNGHIKQ